MLAPTFGVLVFGRVLQAVGAGITLPVLQSIAMTRFPKGQNGTAMGIAGVAMGFAPNIGPLIGGALVDSWGGAASSGCSSPSSSFFDSCGAPPDCARRRPDARRALRRRVLPVFRAWLRRASARFLQRGKPGRAKPARVGACGRGHCVPRAFRGAPKSGSSTRSSACASSSRPTSALALSHRIACSRRSWESR